MTIEFHCPECQALIRVDGRAGGKKGNCPHCQVRLIIPARSGEPAVLVDPVVDPGDSSIYFEAAAEEPADPQSADTAVGIPSSGPRTDPFMQVFPTPNPDDPVLQFQPPARPTLPLRRRKRSALPIVPFFFGGLLLVAVVWIIFQVRTDLTGELHAEVVDPGALSTGLIGFADASADRPTFDRVCDDLANAPLEVLDADNLFKVIVQGTPTGLAVSIEPTRQGACLMVQPRESAELREYVSMQAKRFNETRSNNLRARAANFFRTWASLVGQPRKDIDGLGDYRNHMLLAATVSGFGYHVALDDGSHAYPCVSVGSKGELHFIIPQGGTSPLTLRGRDVGDGLESFPGEFVIHRDGRTPGNASQNPEGCEGRECRRRDRNARTPIETLLIAPPRR